MRKLMERSKIHGMSKQPPKKSSSTYNNPFQQHSCNHILTFKKFCVPLFHVVALHTGGRDSALSFRMSWCKAMSLCHHWTSKNHDEHQSTDRSHTLHYFEDPRSPNIMHKWAKASCTKHELLEFSKKWPIPFQENPSWIAYWEQTNEVVPSILSTSPKGVLSPRSKSS